MAVEVAGVGMLGAFEESPFSALKVGMDTSSVHLEEALYPRV